MKYQLIDTAGQVTAIITNRINLSELPKLANIILANNQQIEQVGYLQNDNFQMMGGELSINGLLAAAFLLGKSGTVNGLKYKNFSNQTTITFPSNLIKKINQDIIYLQGITYQIVKGFPSTKIIFNSTKNKLFMLAEKSPAAGLVYFEDNKIMPLIYVKETDTFVWENACGSGSLSFALSTGKRRIVQPSGEILLFKINKKCITVTASVKEI